MTFSNEFGKDSAPFEIVVKNIKPSITTESLDGMVSVDVAYSSAYLKAEGSKPITWSITDGNLPSGLALDSSSGRITGTPSAEGTFTFEVTAKNAAGTDFKRFSITSRRVKPEIAKENLVYDKVSVNTNTSYEMRIYAKGSNPITFSLVDGNIPEGLTLNYDGTITGKPSKARRYTFTVKAENDFGSDTNGSDTRELKITVLANSANDGQNKGTTDNRESNTGGNGNGEEVNSPNKGDGNSNHHNDGQNEGNDSGSGGGGCELGSGMLMIALLHLLSAGMCYVRKNY